MLCLLFPFLKNSFQFLSLVDRDRVCEPMAVMSGMHKMFWQTENIHIFVCMYAFFQSSGSFTEMSEMSEPQGKNS